MGAAGLGAPLQQPIRVDVRALFVHRCEGRNLGPQNRHPRAGVFCGNRRGLKARAGLFKSCAVLWFGEKHHPARGEEAPVCCGKEIRAGTAEGDGAGQAVVLLKHRGRAPGGVIAKRALPFQNKGFAHRRQPRRRGEPGDAAADDQEISHASSSRSVAGGGVGVSAVSWS